MKLSISDQYYLKYRLYAIISLLAVLPASFARQDKGAPGASKPLKKEDCEVCFGVLEKFDKLLTERSESDPKLKDVKSNPKLIEQEFRKFCKTTKTRENRFCYYLGGLEESATGILSEMSKPLSYALPIEKICEKLKKKDAQICELRYEKVIDFKTVDLKKLKVKDLKNILSSWDESCDGCIEKSDFINRIEELKPQYVKDEL